MAEVSPEDVLTALLATPGVFLTGLGGNIVLEYDDVGPLLVLIFRTGAGLRVSSGLMVWIQEASRVMSVKVTSSLVGVEQAFFDPVLSGVRALLSPVTCTRGK